MLKNYFKTALRNLIKQRFYTLINILGLAVGLACCLMITLFVIDELSFDSHHAKADRIYRVTADIVFNQDAAVIPQLPAPLAQTLVADFPEVETSMRFRTTGDYLIKRKDKEMDNIREERVIFADQSMFDVFSFDIVSGDMATALSDPNTMVITRSMAEKYFPGKDAVGEILTVDNDWEVKITCVIEDLPVTSHFQYDIFLTMESRDEAKQPVWISHNFHTYFVLAEGADPDALEAKFPGMIEKYVGPQIKQFLNIEVAEWEEAGNRMEYGLEYLPDIYLNSPIPNDLGPEGSMTNVFLFAAIALFILILACINFMNLSTARSANRAKEVGVRKVLGSDRRDLINQFLMESILLSMISIVLAVLFAEFALPFFNRMAEKDLDIAYFSSWFIPIGILAGIGIGVLAGIYPAFFLSAFRPVEVLKGKLSAGVKSGWLRSSLVVVQFVASIALIIGTIIVYQQMHFIQNKDLGFNKDQVIMLEETWVLRDKAYPFKNDILNHPEITNATVTSFLPVSGTNRNNTVFWPEGDQSQEKQVLMQRWTVDHDFLETMGMEIATEDGKPIGRDFSLDFPTDSTGMILNETAAKNFGLEGDEAIGFRISTFTDFNEQTGEPTIGTRTVIGVVKDFHFESLKENITGLCMMIGRSTGNISFRTQTEDVGSTLALLEKKWAEYAPGQPFSYSFLDERFSNMYATTLKLRDIFSAFAFLAIFIACLGLFALAAFMAEQRTKEIGIRKVLGANVGNIVMLLSKDFVRLVGIALLFAIPLAWWGMDSWLKSFKYHIDIQVWVFILAGILAIGIAILTVSSQSVRAAYTNPVDALKDE